MGDLADRSVPLERCVATLHRAMAELGDVRQRAARAIEGKGAVWWNP